MRFKTSGSSETGLPHKYVGEVVNICSQTDDVHRSVRLSFKDSGFFLRDPLFFLMFDHIYLTGYITEPELKKVELILYPVATDKEQP